MRWLNGWIKFFRLRKTTRQLRSDLELAADRLTYAANWLENTYNGQPEDVAAVRGYARAARMAARRQPD